jgi:ribonuclease D
MKVALHKYDLPDDVSLGNSVAVDTETLGLKPERDPLCLVQLSSGDGTAHLVQLDRKDYNAPNLKRIFLDNKCLKIFHFARFDVTVLRHYLNVNCQPIFCTKIASKLTRTYTDKHGLKDLCKELLNIDLSKKEQASDWSVEELSKEQLEYAASDVLYLHELKGQLEKKLKKLDRFNLAQDCFNFIKTRTYLDLNGWPDIDIFEH